MTYADDLRYTPAEWAVLTEQDAGRLWLRPSIELAREIIALRAERDALLADKRRLEWLMSCHEDEDDECSAPMDRAWIDKYMAHQREGEAT